MVKDVNQNASGAQPPRRLRLNKRLYIVLICFSISVLFWLLIAMSHEYPAVMIIPVHYNNIPGKKVVINDLPKEITVELKTTGFRILSYRFQKVHDPIEIDVASKLQSASLYSGVLSIPSKSFLSDFSNELGNEVSILSFTPDSITFDFKDRVTKKVPVKLNLTASFMRQYDTTGSPRITPSEVEVSGPPFELDRLASIPTETLVVSDLKSDYHKKVNLVIDKLLTYNVSQVDVVIPVEKFTEGIVDVPVHPVNVTDGFSLKAFPEKVRVRYLVALSNYNKITPSMFDVVVEGSLLQDQHPDKIAVQLMTKPAFVSETSIEPEKVDYILRRQ